MVMYSTMVALCGMIGLFSGSSALVQWFRGFDSLLKELNMVNAVWGCVAVR